MCSGWRVRVLPLAGLGEREARAAGADHAVPAGLAAADAAVAFAASRQRLLLQQGDLVLDDWIDGLRERDDEITAGDGALAEGFARCWFSLESRGLLSKERELQQAAAAVCAQPGTVGGRR